MPKTLIKSRNKAFNHQQGLCFYCKLPIWLYDPLAFSSKYKISPKASKLFQCTAEHLIAKQDGGRDIEGNIVAACYFCNHNRHRCKAPKDPISYKRRVTKRLAKGEWNSVLIHQAL